MKPGLSIGKVGSLTWMVDASMTITFGGEASATVFSTPNMIMLIERAAREWLREFLETGEESVGTEVKIQHIGAASLGATVRGSAQCTRIKSSRLE